MHQRCIFRQNLLISLFSPIDLENFTLVMNAKLAARETDLVC